MRGGLEVDSRGDNAALMLAAMPCSSPFSQTPENKSHNMRNNSCTVRRMCEYRDVTNPNTMNKLFNIINAAGAVIYTNLQRSTWHQGFDWDHMKLTGHVTDSIIKFKGWKAVPA